MRFISVRLPTRARAVSSPQVAGLGTGSRRRSVSPETDSAGGGAARGRLQLSPAPRPRPPAGVIPMRLPSWLLAASLAAGLAAVAPAADPVRHRIMFAEYGKGPNRLVELDADGKVTWEYAFPGIA